MSAPNTMEEIALALGDAATGMDGPAFRRVREMIYFWLAEARANAEPRLRPVSETPEPGSVVIMLDKQTGEFSSARRWPPHDYVPSRYAGWILLERAKPKTLAEEARELGEPPEGRPEMDHFAYVRALEKYAGGAAALLRRVAEEKRGA